VITQVQPMKMAAAEALYTTTTSAPFSLFAYAPPGKQDPTLSVHVPGLLSFLATGSFTGTVQGLSDLQQQYTARYGPGNYVPWLPAAFWSFRLMIGIGMAAAVLAAAYLWFTRKERELPVALTTGRRGRWLIRSIALIPVLPMAANSLGWMFTETARQPWLAFGLFKTADGASPGLSSPEIILSISGFVLVYGALAIVWVKLLQRLVRAGPGAPAENTTADNAAAGTAGEDEDHLILAY
jgi:cytochrome d ubiquinol oxidase subunit I